MPMSRLLCLVLITLTLPSILAHGNPSHRRHRPTSAYVQSPSTSTSIIHTAIDTFTPASIIDDIQCTLCKGLAAGLGPLIRSNASMNVIDAIATEVCEIFKIDCKDPTSCKDVCMGIVHEHAAEVIQILTNTLLSPPEVCYLIKLCPAPTPPPPPVPGVPVPSNCSDHTGEHSWPAWSLKGKGTFLHLSDIHVDLLYQIGTNSACGEPMCCRAVNGPGNATTSAGTWGNYNCDTPMPVLQDLLNYIAKINPQPDFIIYTGDDPAHDVWEQSRDNNLKTVNAICGAMVTAFPHIPVFPAIGNHEAYPVNQFQGPGGDNWLYDGLLVAWSHWLPEDAMHTLKYGGYYTARIRPGLRVVAINTNMYITENFWLYENHTDISSQFTWFDNVCSQASSLNEQVIIIGHQHSGSWYQDFSLQYNNIVEKWDQIIVGQFYGHVHSDSMSLWYTNSSNIQTPAGIAYIGGSVTPYTNMNPGYKSYVYSRELNNPYKVLVEDFSQYWTDLTVANVNNQSTWNILAFNALRDLEMSDLSLASWVALGNTFRTSNATQDVWNAYLNHKYHGAISINGRDSQASIGCDILSTTHAQRDACEKETTGFVSIKPKPKC